MDPPSSNDRQNDAKPQMGRSQVIRNRTHGRPGQQGRGRGSAGRGGSAGGRGGRSSRHINNKGGGDPSRLGDNSFRYRSSNADADGSDRGDGNYDGLLDDINFNLSSGGYGDYYGSSHYDAINEEEELADATISALFNSSLHRSNNTQLSNSTTSNTENSINTILEGSTEDYLSIDISSLSKCLQQLPIHTMLNVPWHVGRHLEEMYGQSSGSGRKKTLAELREDARCTVGEIDAGVGKGGESSADVMKEANAKSSSQSTSIERDSNTDKGGGGDEEDEEDLEAWLDDMIG